MSVTADKPLVRVIHERIWDHPSANNRHAPLLAVCGKFVDPREACDRLDDVTCPDCQRERAHMESVEI